MALRMFASARPFAFWGVNLSSHTYHLLFSSPLLKRGSCTTRLIYSSHSTEVKMRSRKLTSLMFYEVVLYIEWIGPCEYYTFRQAAVLLCTTKSSAVAVTNS
ncbi:hypothetical protein K439DRAFT_523114 [Ramaria rubella]|nr:hypothetical protein K439DRAFT_523114 [Ramaria rubella]